MRFDRHNELVAARTPNGELRGVRPLRATCTSPSSNDPVRLPAGVRCDVAAVARASAPSPRPSAPAMYVAWRRCWVQAAVRLVLVRVGQACLWRACRAAQIASPLLRGAAPAARPDPRCSPTYRFNGYEAQRVIGHFLLRFRPQRQRLPRGAELEGCGKGAIDCSATRCSAWSLSWAARRGSRRGRRGGPSSADVSRSTRRCSDRVRPGTGRDRRSSGSCRTRHRCRLGRRYTAGRRRSRRGRRRRPSRVDRHRG
jgi:hypothetical protein